MKLCIGSEIQNRCLQNPFRLADTVIGTGRPQPMLPAAVCFVKILNCGIFLTYRKRFVKFLQEPVYISKENRAYYLVS